MAARIDAELDLHGHTTGTARDQLNLAWSRRAWQGMRRVRIIHGTGEVLYQVVRRWADEKSIPWTIEPHNTGVTILQTGLWRDPSSSTPNLPFARLHEKLRTAVPPDVPKRRRPPPSAPAPVSLPPQPPQPSARDLFAQEMERLAEQDPRTMHRRKNGA